MTSVKVTLQLAVRKSVCLSVKSHSVVQNQICVFVKTVTVLSWRPL
jgi:hypothetical protein